MLKPSAATVKRIALISSSSVSFLIFADPEKGDPNVGMFILFVVYDLLESAIGGTEYQGTNR
jgi:hypothetical protein